jgi:hypothetical protein
MDKMVNVSTPPREVMKVEPREAGITSEAGRPDPIRREDKLAPLGPETHWRVWRMLSLARAD